MGETTEALKVVLDTNSVLSAVLFHHGRLTWLRDLREARRIQPFVSRPTVDELLRALAYPKFRLTESEIGTLLTSYLLQAEVVPSSSKPSRQVPRCRDPEDQMFLDLAFVAGADVLVSGDGDLLAHRDEVPFAVETPSEFKKRFRPGDDDSTRE